MDNRLDVQVCHFVTWLCFAKIGFVLGFRSADWGRLGLEIGVDIAFPATRPRWPRVFRRAYFFDACFWRRSPNFLRAAGGMAFGLVMMAEASA